MTTKVRTSQTTLKAEVQKTGQKSDIVDPPIVYQFSNRRGFVDSGPRRGIYTPDTSYCAGFSGVLCLNGDDASLFGVGGTGGTVTSDGTEFTVNHVGSYGGYVPIATTPGNTYRMTLNLTSTPTSFFYVEAYDGNGLWDTGIAILEPMNNEIGLSGVVYGDFTATTSLTWVIFGSYGGVAYTFKNLKVENIT